MTAMVCVIRLQGPNAGTGISVSDGHYCFLCTATNEDSVDLRLLNNVTGGFCGFTPAMIP